MIAALLLAAQAVATPAVPLLSARRPGTPPQRIILANCPPGTGDEIVVCGASDQAIPWSDGPPPDRPMPSNPELTGIGALAAVPTPCAATQWGCQVGIDILGMGAAVGRLIGKLVDPDSCCERPGEATSGAMLIGDAIEGIGKAFRKKPDRTKRIAIDLDAPPPPIAGRLSR